MFKLKPNIGTLNALIRITVGLAMVAFATAKLARKPWCFTAKLSTVLGAMKVAEGIVRFCPITELMKFNKYMNLPVMSLMKQGKSKQDEAHHSANDNASDEKIEEEIAGVLGQMNNKPSQSAPHQAASHHREEKSYDASDKKIEDEIASAVLGIK